MNKVAVVPVSYAISYRPLFYPIASLQSPTDTILVTEAYGAITDVTDPLETNAIRRSACDLSDNLVWTSPPDRTFQCCTFPKDQVYYATGALGSTQPWPYGGTHFGSPALIPTHSAVQTIAWQTVIPCSASRPASPTASSTIMARLPA